MPCTMTGILTVIFLLNGIQRGLMQVICSRLCWFYRTDAVDNASAVFAMALCPSVCLSVRVLNCLLQAGIASKRLHATSWFFSHVDFLRVPRYEEIRIGYLQNDLCPKLSAACQSSQVLSTVDRRLLPVYHQPFSFV